MKIGFITNSLAGAGVKDIVDISLWAKENGFEDLEVGPSIELDENKFEMAMKKSGIRISALIYCRNFLSENKNEAEYHLNELKKRIEFAGKMGIEKVVASSGATGKSFDGRIIFNPWESVSEVVELFKSIMEMAEASNIKIAYENCPMMGNIAIAPDIWHEIFERVGSDKLGLAYDPSHLIWQFIDPYEPVYEFKDRIFHVHAKDTEILWNRLKRNGIMGDQKWHRYRIPGSGEINWGRLITALYEIGFDGTISIEHEDVIWEGTLERVQKGLLKGKEYLQQYI